jgi:hypothetical protein
MRHVRYTEAEIDELCQIPPWTNTALDKQTKQIHDAVPLTRKVIVDQCLYWTDVAHRFKRNMCPRRAADLAESPESTFVVGVIGCGSVGSKFVRELLKRQLVTPSQIKISSRTPSRAKQRCGLEVVANNMEVATGCSILLLFVLPYHFRNFSREIRETIQKTRPLIISTLAGFTQSYLQRALNTQFLITTCVDIPTIQAGAENLEAEYPLVKFAIGDEIQYLGEQLLRQEEVDQLALTEPAPQNPPDASADSQAEPPLAADAEPDLDQPITTRALAAPELVHITDPKTLRRFHQATFSAASLIKGGLQGLRSTIDALRSWVSLDPNHARSNQKPETYARLWARSFIPIPIENCIDDPETTHLPLIAAVLKRSFVRSLLGPKWNEAGHEPTEPTAPA